MSDVNASLAAGTARPAAGNGGGETTVRVVDPSPELARLATGDNLRGTVVGRDDHGHLQVRTRLGVLTLAVPRALPVGTEVVLQVRNVGPQVLLNLLPLDLAVGTAARAQGTAPAPPGTAQPGPLQPAPVQPGQATSSPGAAAPLSPNPSDLVQRGQLLRAVLHAAPPLPSLAGLPAALPGSELAVRVLSLGIQPPALAAPAAPVAPSAGAVPSGAAPPAGGAVPVAGPVPTGPGSPVASPATVAGGGKLPSAGVPTTPAAVPALAPVATAPGLRAAPQVPVAVSGHSLAAVLQTATSEAAAKAAGGTLTPADGPVAPPAAAPLRLTALVTASTSGGHPILHTPLGTLTLDTRAMLPPGTSLALEVLLPAAVREAAMAALPPAWPSVESLEESLFQGLPAVQAEAVARALPQVGPRLASGILFFLAALNQGNVGGWLAQAGGGAAGERADLTGNLAERLAREFAGLARSVDTPTGEWRFVNLPLWSDAGLRELRCFYRHQHGAAGGGADGDKATRFVVELELQRHGELQLDGLVRRRLFDLVLRSRRPLPPVVRVDLLALFEEANAIAGYNGRLTFQASQDWLQLLAGRGAAEQHEGFRV